MERGRTALATITEEGFWLDREPLETFESPHGSKAGVVAIVVRWFAHVATTVEIQILERVLVLEYPMPQVGVGELVTVLGQAAVVHIDG
jgi:hypothetical protein